MAGVEENTDDFYATLGLKKECSEAELRIAYKKLAMKWHPDKCSASGSAKRMEEAKVKFQEIQKAYSGPFYTPLSSPLLCSLRPSSPCFLYTISSEVLSDSNKRFLYDFGVYDKDDDNDEEGMGDFIWEMAQMMSQTKPSGSGHVSVEELQRLFMETFHDDLGAGFSGPRFSTSTSGGGSNKRGNSAVDSGKEKMDELDSAAGGFCFGSNDAGQSSTGRGSTKRRNARKQTASSKHDN